jgi:hypothetical protein
MQKYGEVEVHSLTSALDTSEWLASGPGCFTPEKESRCLLGRRLGGPQSQSGCCVEEKDPSLSGIETRSSSL